LIGTVNIPGACIHLKESTNCSVAVILDIAGRTIFNERLDTTIAPVVCGGYDFSQVGIQTYCNICVSLQTDPNNAQGQCVSMNPTCRLTGINLPVPLSKYNAGCFTSSRLDDLERCRNTQCPSVNQQLCSGHGNCINGKCNCGTGWFGSDCSYSATLFEKCQRVDQLSGNVCVRLVFDSCNINLIMILQSGFIELPLYNKAYPVRDLNVVFRQDICIQQLGCDLCLRWTNLELTEYSVKGCGTLSMTCSGLTVGTYPLDCFSDTQVLPACIGKCPNDCSGHGTCDKGMCRCAPQYVNDDCSALSLKCPNDCSNHGACTGGSCGCDSGYSGDDCATSTAESQPKSRFNPAFVIVPIVLVIAGVAAGGVVYYMKKRRDEKPKFNHFDLLEEEELKGSINSEEQPE